MNRLEVSVVTVAAVAGLAGVSYKNLHDTKVYSSVCEAIDTHGDRVKRVSYPIGQIAVKYQKERWFGNKVTEAIGTITEERAGLVLHIPGLPEHLANDYTDFDRTDAKVIVTLPKLGQVGLTKECVNEPEHRVQLPLQRK